MLASWTPPRLKKSHPWGWEVFPLAFVDATQNKSFVSGGCVGDVHVTRMAWDALRLTKAVPRKQQKMRTVTFWTSESNKKVSFRPDNSNTVKGAEGHTLKTRKTPQPPPAWARNLLAHGPRTHNPEQSSLDGPAGTHRDHTGWAGGRGGHEVWMVEGGRFTARPSLRAKLCFNPLLDTRACHPPPLLGTHHPLGSKNKEGKMHFSSRSRPFLPRFCGCIFCSV